jgi:Transposase
MARREARPLAEREVRLTPRRMYCVNCEQRLWVAYHAQRTLMTFRGLVRLTLVVRRCRNQECDLYHLPYRAEEEGAWALPHGEFGLDIITVVGQLRYGEHRSIPEIHQRLVQRGVVIAQRTVTDLLERYEELVALHLADEERLLERLKQQGQVILAIDGMQPHVGHEVLWVIRDCLSGQVLLARSLLSSTQKDLSALLREVTEALPVPIRGVISDGQKTIRKAVAKQLPGIPHQLCQFHYVREAAKPIFEADRHAKTELKKLVRGVRPIERSLDGQEDEQAEAMQGYCLAVRSALTDDGRPPLGASGLKLHDRLTQISDSLTRALKKTEALWPTIEKAYALVHQTAHVLANHEEESGQAVRERYQAVLLTMREQQASLGPLSGAITTFLKVTTSYWPGLFQCYDVADLPRTDNELEQCFGSVRYGERRAWGRRGAMAGLVVRGPARVLTALALRRQCFLPRALYLKDPEAWFMMREQLTSRREARRKQLRFRKDPAAYLAALEDILLKTSLPS